MEQHRRQGRRPVGKALELLADLFGWCVVDERYAEAIKEVELAEKRDEIERQLTLTRAKRRSGGR